MFEYIKVSSYAEQSIYGRRLESAQGGQTEQDIGYILSMKVVQKSMPSRRMKSRNICKEFGRSSKMLGLCITASYDSTPQEAVQQVIREYIRSWTEMLERRKSSNKEPAVDTRNIAPVG